MTKIYRNNLYRAVFLLAPLLLFDAGCTQAAPDTRPSHQTVIPAEASSVQIFSMEFRHPVADGALVRIVCQIDAPVKNALSAEEITAKGLDPNSFISCDSGQKKCAPRIMPVLDSTIAFRIPEGFL